MFSFSCLIRAPSAGRILSDPIETIEPWKTSLVVPIVLAGQQIFPLPIGSMYAIYMVTFNINIPQMLAYIPAPWILWYIYIISWCLTSSKLWSTKTSTFFEISWWGEPSLRVDIVALGPSVACAMQRARPTLEKQVRPDGEVFGNGCGRTLEKHRKTYRMVPPSYKLVYKPH